MGGGCRGKRNAHRRDFVSRRRRPFELMMGKLVGVGLAGLTQLAIWMISAIALLAVGVRRSMSAAGIPTFDAEYHAA